MANTLTSKRNKSLWLILGAAVGTGGASGAPTPVIELAKQIGIGAADVLMCMKIYEIYFDEKLTVADLFDSLSAAGFVLTTAAGGAYVAVKLTEGLLAEVTNILGPLGWMFSAGLTATVTTALGLAWLAFVHSSYVEQHRRPRTA